jgi:hypothetical protein
MPVVFFLMSFKVLRPTTSPCMLTSVEMIGFEESILPIISALKGSPFRGAFGQDDVLAFIPWGRERTVGLGKLGRPPRRAPTDGFTSVWVGNQSK